MSSFGYRWSGYGKGFSFFNTSIVLLFLVVDVVYGLTVFLVCDILLRLLLCIIRLPMVMFIFIAFMFSFISGRSYLQDKTSEVFDFEQIKVRDILMGGLESRSKN